MDDGNEDSVAADYEDSAEVLHRISPTTNPKWRNTLRPFPKPVACWRMNHAYLRFDSSVIVPEVAGELTKLAPLARDDRQATIFGHADPVGSVDYNAKLSARRARSLYGLLTRNVDVWLHLFTPVEGDRWGLESSQTMLAALPRQDGAGPYYAGLIDGVAGPLTDKATRAFQGDEGLAVDGTAGPITRRRLYERYIDSLTGTPEQPLMRADQFLGDPADAAQASGKAKAAYQGCSELNPILLFSAEDERRLSGQQDKRERNERNAPNRRAMVFFFRKADFVGMSPAQVASSWPCPAWDEGAAACRSQLWTDSADRLKNGELERRYESGERTMSCAWYDRFARLSPCEGHRRLPAALASDYPFSL
jgi:hypothetical protein